MDEESRKALKSDKVEYRQGNLLNAGELVGRWTFGDDSLRKLGKKSWASAR